MTTDTLVLWRDDYDLMRPVRVECPSGGYPASDADGVRICDNTHWPTEEESWESMRREVEAHVCCRASDVKNAERGLVLARERAAEACKEMAEYLDSRDKRRRAERKGR